MSRRYDPLMKPPPGTEIDWGHPLAQGLVGCWLFNEGAGSFTRSLVAPADRLTNTSGSWGVTTAGIVGLSATAATPNWQLTTPSSLLLPATNVTLFWSGVITGNRAGAVDNPRIFSLEYDNANGSPFISYGFYRNSNTAVTGAWNNSGTFAAASTIATPATGVPFSLALTHDGSAVTTYLNGIAKTTGTGGTINYSATARLIIGTAGGSQDVGVASTTGFIYARTLGKTELLRLHTSPYCFLKNPRRRSYLLPESSSFNPAWARGTNVLIQPGVMT